MLMKRLILILTVSLIFILKSWAAGEPSTYFNIYVPPNNDAVQRNVALIVTAIHDSTSFTITDDDLDGDSDDSFSGMLMAGQSYILYIKDNGINDDAPYASGGELKQDGDYFIIESNKLVYASMSTDSDWQHDFVASVNKKSVGEKFIVYSPKISSSLRDLNVFAFEENTTVTISKISQSATTQTGYTNVNPDAKEVVAQRTLNPGEDIIYFYQDGRNLMNTGETYMIESNKDVSVQYGALYQNERDGGAYVPSKSGSSSGELFYFAVPYQARGEQEIRVISWDDNNEIILERFSNGNWVSINSWELNSNQPADWVGKQQGNVNYQTVFRVQCTAGKKVSVFEANWMETGYTSTSDMATMVSSSNGTTSGDTFLVYLLPPGAQNNVVNPFTGQKFNNSYSHLYLFAGKNDAVVTIKDAKTNGEVLHKTFNIEAGRYADAIFSLEEWRSIYNGTGAPTGSERPYVLVESSSNISMLSSNFNDNWMTYFGSSLPQSFTQNTSVDVSSGLPGDTISLVSEIVLEGATIEKTQIELQVSSGAIPVKSTLKNRNNNTSINGSINYQESMSIITFDSVPSITSGDDYQVETKLVLSTSYNNGEPISDGTVVSVETVVTGEVDGELQQSILSQGVENNASNTSNLLFSTCADALGENNTGDNWNAAWVDTDNDGFEDLIITDKHQDTKNSYFQNHSGSLALNTTPDFLQNGKSTSTLWADVNNDGLSDVFVVNATGKASLLYINQGGNHFVAVPNSGISVHPQYFHGGAFADFDNDGFVDLLVTNFFPTKFHHLYRNKGNNTFELVESTHVSTVSARAMAPILSDYNQDGLVDIFIPNGSNEANSLFKNLGGFQFEKVEQGAIVTDTFNSVGAAWGDYDGDGDQDLYVVNASGQPNNLYQNDGHGTFTSILNNLIVEGNGHSHSASWIDVDNDADLDLFVTDDQKANQLFINNGDGSFYKKLDEIIAGHVGKAYGIAWADYNKDGALDAFLSTHGGDENKLYCHNGTSNNWISFKLLGTSSNTNALGATVRIKANGKWQLKEVLPVSGFGSQNSLQAHFGLGISNSIDSVMINWPSGAKQYFESVPVNSFLTIQEEGASAVTVITFNDENANGIKEANEKTVGNISLQMLPNNKVVKSDKNGITVWHLAEGDYLLNTTGMVNWESSSALSVEVFNLTDTTYYFPLKVLNDGHDLSINFHTTAWRRGFQSETLIQVANGGSSEASDAIVRVTYPAEVQVVSSVNDYQMMAENVYEWNIPTIQPGETVLFNVNDSVGLNSSVGQVLTVMASVEALGTELDSTNNKFETEVEVVGAVDPNDMVASPKGEGTEGYVHKNQWLTYTIRFQNVGSFYATYVTLDNELSKNLDLETFEVIASSHPYEYSLNDDKLQVKYEKIFLPSTEVDEPGSHGYFTYRIKPDESVSGGEQIRNAANITFDFEAPIATNTVQHTIKYKGDGRVHAIRIYPNPATTRAEIQLDDEFLKYEQNPLICQFNIRDSAGKLVLELKNMNDLTFELAVDRLSKGLYFVGAIDQNGVKYQGKLIVQ